jgi:hypothetical protein
MSVVHTAVTPAEAGAPLLSSADASSRTPAFAGATERVGLSNRTQALWLAALRYRRLADAAARKVTL